MNKCPRRGNHPKGGAKSCRYCSNKGNFLQRLRRKNSRLSPSIEISEEPERYSGYLDGALYYSYFVNNKLHKEDGPAHIMFNPNHGDEGEGEILTESYYNNGKLHREDGPAEIDYHWSGNVEVESYYINGQYREDGPAVIEYNRDGSLKRTIHYANGVQISDIQY